MSLGTDRLKRLIWATFVNNWHALLSDFSDRREKKAQKMTTQKTFTKRILSKKSIGDRNIRRCVIFGIQEDGKNSQ